MAESSKTYGSKIGPSVYNPQRSLMQSPSLSGAGNTVIRVGREWEQAGGGWHQTEHVVLSPAEAEEFTLEMVLSLGDRAADAATMAAAKRPGTRAAKVAALADALTAEVCARLRDRNVIPEGATGVLNPDEVAALERIVATQLLTGRRGLYTGTE